MFKRFSINYMIVLFLVDGVLIQFSLWLGTQLRYVSPFGEEVLPEFAYRYFNPPGWGIHLDVYIIWTIVFLLLSVYSPRRILFWTEEFQRVIVAHTLAALSLAGALYLARVDMLRLIFIYFYLSGLVFLLGYRVLLRLHHRLGRHASESTSRVLVVGTGRGGRAIATHFAEQSWAGISVEGFLHESTGAPPTQELPAPVLGDLSTAAAVVDRHHIDTVIVALPRDAHTHLVNLVTRLQALPVRVHVVPDYFDLAFHNATISMLGGIPLIGLRDPAIDGFQRACKRVFDLIVSGGGLLLLSPIFAAVALAIWLEDGHPIFYRAQRVGENGQLFAMLKFRSMIRDADKQQTVVNSTDGEGHIVHKQQGDPRITRVGRIIRRTSVDELPQLINVFRGDMSLVGPRPELPWLVEQYEPWQRKRFAVPQGITGWWQVNGRSDKLMHLNTDLDLYYIQHYSLWLDIQILWRTIGVVLRGRGAY